MSIMQCLFASSLDSFIFIKSVTSSSSTITIPTEASEGDFAVLFDAAYNFAVFGAPTPTTIIPSGFTSVQNDNGGTFFEQARDTISYKVLNSSDSGTTITGMNAEALRKILLIFRPNNKITTVSEVSTGQLTSNSSNPSNQTISMNGKTTPIIGIAHYAAEDSVTTRGDSSSSMTEVSSDNLTQYVKFIIYSGGSNPQNITVSINGSTNLRLLQSAYFTFT